MPINDPTTATPSEIDTELNRLDIERAKVQATLGRLIKWCQRLVDTGMEDSVPELQPRIEETRKKVAEYEAAAQPLDAE